jgi:hypothetical protein
MHISPIKRRVTRKIRVGNVYVGGDAPITVQTMTNTDTCDVAATVAQIQRCVAVGADIVRVFRCLRWRRPRRLAGSGSRCRGCRWWRTFI